MSQSFSASYCDPSRPDPVHEGIYPSHTLVDKFAKFPWGEMLKKTEGRPREKVHFSPSLRFENTENGSSLEITLVEVLDEGSAHPSGSGGRKNFYAFYVSGSTSEKSSSSMMELLDVSEAVATSLVRDFSLSRHASLRKRFAERPMPAKSTNSESSKLPSLRQFLVASFVVNWPWYLPCWIWAFALPPSIVFELYPKGFLQWGEWSLITQGICCLPLILLPLFKDVSIPGYSSVRRPDFLLVAFIVPALLATASYHLLKLFGIT